MPHVKENRLPDLRNILNGCYDGFNEPSPTATVSLSAIDHQAFRILCEKANHKLKKDSVTPIGGGGAMVLVSDLLTAIKSLPADTPIEVDVLVEE